MKGYAHTKYPFASEEDKHTLLEALQHPQVYAYLQHPGSFHAPPELARVISPSNDLYTLGVAEQLVAHNMVPQNDEQRAILDAFNANRKGLFERAAFFYNILERNINKSRNLPSIFYPLMYSESTEHAANQLCDIMPDLHIDVERVFFRLVVKFGRRSNRQMPDNDGCILDWKFPRSQKDDPDGAVYSEAADAVCDYIEVLRNDYGACKGLRQPIDVLRAWIAWMEDEGVYPNFLARVQTDARSYRNIVSTLKYFIWKYLELGDTKRLKL